MGVNICYIKNDDDLEQQVDRHKLLLLYLLCLSR